MSKKFYSANARKQLYKRKCLVDSYKKRGRAPDSFYEKYKFEAPSNFSLIENPEETVLYFNKIINFVLTIDDFVKVRFDLNRVEKMTIDAIIYMIAISNNIESKYKTKYNILLPKDEELVKFVLSSGIDKFFDAGEFEINKNGDFFSIKMGNKTNVEVAKGICDFTNAYLETNTKFTGFLYDMLIEMMTNAGQHAYTIKEKIKNQWFIFAENSESSIRYTFIDTGLGIPKTMSKYMIQISEGEIEKDGCLKSILDNFSEDENADTILLLTGLKEGGFRTRTDKPYRGKGLPEIYDHYWKDKKTANLKIISGACLCEFDEQNREQSFITNLKDKFVGTLFYWEIEKNKKMEVSFNGL